MHKEKFISSLFRTPLGQGRKFYFPPDNPHRAKLMKYSLTNENLTMKLTPLRLQIFLGEYFLTKTTQDLLHFQCAKVI